jgi:hypothetical protein
MPITDQNSAYRFILWSLVSGRWSLVFGRWSEWHVIFMLPTVTAVSILFWTDMCHSRPFDEYQSLSKTVRIALSYDTWSLVWMACNLYAANGYSSKYTFWTYMCSRGPFDKYRSLTKTVRIALSYDSWSLVWMACNLLAANGSSS